jgi:transcriptional regulator with XRE-family HTH domain
MDEENMRESPGAVETTSKKMRGSLSAIGDTDLLDSPGWQLNHECQEKPTNCLGPEIKTRSPREPPLSSSLGSDGFETALVGASRVQAVERLDPNIYNLSPTPAPVRTYRGESLTGLLREIRLYRAWTQQHVAARAGLSRQWLSEVESGRTVPRLDSLLALLGAYDLGIRLVPAWDEQADAPRTDCEAHVDAGWFDRSGITDELERVLDAPDGRVRPYNLLTAWGKPRRDARARKRRWLRARLEYLDRLRALANEYEREVRAELARDRAGGVRRERRGGGR